MSNLDELKRIAEEGGADVSGVRCNEDALALISGSGSGSGALIINMTFDEAENVFFSKPDGSAVSYDDIVGAMPFVYVKVDDDSGVRYHQVLYVSTYNIAGYGVNGGGTYESIYAELTDGYLPHAES